MLELILIGYLLIWLFMKLFWGIGDKWDKSEAAEEARKENRPYYQIKDKYYCTKTSERLDRVYNTMTRDYEYKTKEGKVIYAEIEDWRKKQEHDSEIEWNSVFQWDSCPENNTGVIKGVRYKDKKTGHLLVIRDIYVNQKKCKVYVDLNTMTYARRTDGQINRELRYKHYYPNQKEMIIDEDKLRESLLEESRDLRSAMLMDKNNPNKRFALEMHALDDHTGDYEEAKMKWFGTSEEKKLLTENCGSIKTRRWGKYC